MTHMDMEIALCVGETPIKKKYQRIGQMVTAVIVLFTKKNMIKGITEMYLNAGWGLRW